MSIREEAHELLDRLSQEDLARLVKIMEDLTKLPQQQKAPMTREERRAILLPIIGSSPRLPSVDEFLKQKHEENERDEARLARREP